MIDTPKFPDGSIKIAPGTVAPKIAGQSTSGIQYLKPDALINALVAKHDANGNPILRTIAGDITFLSQIPLSLGSSVVLKVLTNSKLPTAAKPGELPYNFQAKIVTVDGQHPQPPPQQSTGTGQAEQGAYKSYNVITAISINETTSGQAGEVQNQPQPASAATTSAQNIPKPEATIVNVSNGKVLDSVVINPSYNASLYLPKNAGELRPADNVVLHVLSVKLPEGAVSVTPVTAQNIYSAEEETPIVNQSLGKIPSTPVNTATVMQKNPYTTSIPAPTILPGQEGEKNITQEIPIKINPMTNNKAFTATVVGTEKSGDIVLKTPLGTMKLSPDIALPSGTDLKLEVIRLSGTQTERVVSDLATGAGIKELQEEQKQIVNDLVNIAINMGEEGKALIRNRIPMADKQFLAKLLWFMAGIKKGDEELWLGRDLTSRLQQEGRTELLSALRSHFTSLGKLADGLPNSNWNVFLFPVFDGQQFQSGIMYTRYYKEGEEGAAQDGNRFVVELDLSYLGAIQIDGFVKQLQRRKQLDIFVRSRRELEENIESDIREIFIASIEIMGINGNINFQQVDEFSINPAGELSKKEDNAGSIIV